MPALHIFFVLGDTVEGGINMQVKTFFLTLGLGAAAGAAAVFLMPKDSKIYRKADDIADNIKIEAGCMIDKMCGR